jgi:hypothetical protein
MDFSKINFNRDTAGDPPKQESKDSSSDKNVSQDLKNAPKAGLNFGNLKLPGAATPVAQPSQNDSTESSSSSEVKKPTEKSESTRVDPDEQASKSVSEVPAPAFSLNFPKASVPVKSTPVIQEPASVAAPVVEDVEPVRESFGKTSESISNTVENPLLDDDEDEFESAPSNSFDRSLGSWERASGSDSDDDDSPFMGFPKASTNTTNANATNVDNVVEYDDGFDDQFEDLLEDETYESYTTNVESVPEANATNVDSIVVANAREVVRSNSSSVVEVDPKVGEDLARRLVERKEARRERDANRPKAKKKAPVRTKLESEFVRQGPKEVLVDGSGRPIDKTSSTTTNAKKAVGDKQRYRYMRPDGKLNIAELEFFKNAQVNRTAAISNPSEIERLRGPVNRNETEAERRERSKHIARVAAGRKGMERGRSPRFGQKEREVLEFLAMFRYATDHQLARMFSEAPGTAYNRLKRLRQQGLVIDKKIYGNRPIWFLTDAGIVISGYDLPRITESKLTFSMFPHQFTVNNTAANLWGANIDVLGLPDYPSKNRLNSKGELTFGENLVSELEIQSSFGKVKSFEKADVFRPALMSNIDREFAKWQSAGGLESGSSPEMHYGNEYMWSLMPPYNIHLAYHVPDLVIKRDRNADGTPNSIAVEIEISNKAADSYEKTLLAYKADKRLYSKVIWVCKSAGPAGKLERIAKDIGLWQEGRIDVVPIVTENGVFKDRDLWTI